jgi:type IV pilus assembly protein PilM
MSDSIWKKEISFKRKPKAKAEPESVRAAEPKQSIWKKEISLGRKTEQPKPEPSASVSVVPEANPGGTRPLLHAAGDYEWLSEGFESEPADTGPAQAPRPQIQLAPAPSSPGPAAEPQQTPAAPNPSFLKGEMPFGRRSRDPAEPKQPKASRHPRLSARGKQFVGLKIGASQIAAARVVNNGGAELAQVARADLEPGLVVGGELRDPDGLADALRDFFHVHRLPKRNVRLGISNNRIGVRTFEISGITDPKQLANAIRFKAQEALPIPIEEAVLDYRVLSQGTNEDGEPTSRILLVVAYRELVDRYLAACRKAGIALSGIDLEAFALLRSLAAPRGDGDDSDAALVAVAVGHDRSTLAVSDGRVCEFTRVVEWGGSAINVAIARALDISPPEAEPVKRRLSLHAPQTIEGLTPEQSQTVQEAARRQIHTFARELVSSLQFYQAQPGSLGIGEIVLTGGTAHLPGFAEDLERLMGVIVRIGDPLARIRVSKRVGEPEQLGSLAVAIGLAIED